MVAQTCEHDVAAIAWGAVASFGGDSEFEDLKQEAMVGICRGMRQLDAELPIEMQRAYLRTAAKSRVLDYLRQRVRAKRKQQCGWKKTVANNLLYDDVEDLVLAVDRVQAETPESVAIAADTQGQIGEIFKETRARLTKTQKELFDAAMEGKDLPQRWADKGENMIAWHARGIHKVLSQVAARHGVEDLRNARPRFTNGTVEWGWTRGA